ncbi:MAG: ATP-dependent DNA helicase [Methanomassiliicoccales archaeon]|jgi:DNA excision repair protein ERCC-2
MEAHEPSLGPSDAENGLFPFSEVREGQRQFLEDARSCMRSRVNLVAHAPTGMGKTAVAMTAALETALAEGGVTVFMTARQSQHNAAIETARHIWRKRRVAVVDIISREDSCLCSRRGEGPPCQASKECYFLDKERIEGAASRLLDYPLHVSEAQRLCLRMGACPWHAAMAASGSADVIVCDYNQMFSCEGGSMLERTGRDAGDVILIVDEAHNLPARIVENCSVGLGRSSLCSAIRSTGNRRFRTALQGMLELYDKVCFESQREIAAEELESIIYDRCGSSCGELADEIGSTLRGRMRKSMERVVTFLKAWNASGSSSFRFADPSTGELHCRYMEPWLVAVGVLESVRCSILMSGTLHPPEMFADLLGIGDMCACRRYATPFPPENRNLIAVTDVTSRFDRRCDEMYAHIGRRLSQMCYEVPGNVAAFFPSYEMLGLVEAAIRKGDPPRRILSERRDMVKSEKDAMLMSLRQNGTSLLMATISGSFGEGVDFPDNLLSAVAIVGFPLGPPSIESDEMVRRLAKRYGQSKALMYVKTYPAVTKVLQAAGRAIRSETDRASIVLMDERYQATSVRTAFPEDFRYSRSADLGSDLRTFHAAEPELDIVPAVQGASEKGY